MPPQTHFTLQLSSKSLCLSHSLSVFPCLSLLRELENWLQKATAVNKDQPHSWACPLYLSRHGVGGFWWERERETRRMEKNSFDQSLKPITRRKLLTQGLSSAVCLCLLLSLHPSDMTPPSLPLLSLLGSLSFVHVSPYLSSLFVFSNHSSDVKLRFPTHESRNPYFLPSL